jgi:hypothetical protein
MNLQSIHIEAIYVVFLAGTIVPLLVGLATKYEASGGLKAIIAIVFTAAVSVINAITSTDGTFVVRDTVLLFFAQFITHVAIFFGVWRPAEVPQKLAPESGLG